MPDVDPKKIKLDIQPSSLTFSGYSESKKADYGVTLEFFAEIDPSASKIHHSPRAIELVLQKKELKAEYWDRLLKDSKKVHFLKTDFDKVRDLDYSLFASARTLAVLAGQPQPPPTPPCTPVSAASSFEAASFPSVKPAHRPPAHAPFLEQSRLNRASTYVGVIACWFTVLTFALSKQWVDEDEQDEVADDDDYMSRMGGMGGMGADGGFGGIDFSKLGGAGMGGMGGDDDEDAEDDDEEMPELEGEDDAKEGAAGADKGKAKIEEVA